MARRAAESRKRRNHYEHDKQHDHADRDRDRNRRALKHHPPVPDADPDALESVQGPHTRARVCASVDRRSCRLRRPASVFSFQHAVPLR